MTLYPLLFKPIIKNKIWGSESWQLSACGSDQSVVQNGYLADNELSEIVDIYMDDLVGGKVYEQYDNSFPLLFKFIDAQADLSIQVHPNDRIAYERYQAPGKTELWYVTHATNDANVIVGLTNDMSQDQVEELLNTHQLHTALQRIAVNKGDILFIPAGVVHALCRGTKVAEIQQSSDITYRLYDYQRRDTNGNLRELHIEEGLVSMNYTAQKQPKINYHSVDNGAVNLVRDSHFTTNLLSLNKTIERDYAPLDSFVVYMCVEGHVEITALDADSDNQTVVINEGETVLIPASLNEIHLRPLSPTKLLETYIQ